ncbi:Actin-like 6A [Dermatophagoides pteronyssinus]|uniref:Actin-like 6A n=1 Tax=Dermatophagoides pteronyssinus TaxID=6956 RepID=A0ABQ8J1F0_DERPT|nr:Actin-like 6A [Dermatophagoides pteronyssinus]
MSNVYGGDEVGAIVFDVGSFSTKVGYAGEDAPKSEIPSIVAIHDAPSKLAAEMDRVDSGSSSTGSKERRFYIDTTQVNVARPGQEIKTFLRDGMIDDWDLFEKMLDYIYARHIMSESSQHPVMFSEVSWNSKKCREKITEIMFEKYNVPAFYLAKNAMLVAFSVGRPSGIVFDSGADHTAAIPVYEGYVIEKAIKRNHFAGEFITSLCYKHLNEMKVEVNPYYMIKSKQPVEPGQPAIWNKRQIADGLTNSWQNYMLLSEIRNYKASVLKVYDTKYDLNEAEKYYDPINYHFPDGYNMDVSLNDQFLIPEIFFNKSFNISEFIQQQQQTSTTCSYSYLSNLPKEWLTYPDLLLSSVNECDIDIRPLLLSSIILAGGNTLIEGFTDRMTNEMMATAPKNVRHKVVANNSSTERKYASWIGGSILASLGTFQQLWISKLEYDESGKSCIHKDNLTT